MSPVSPTSKSLSSRQPTCENAPDEEQSLSTLVSPNGRTAGAATKKKTPGSDSGYSSKTTATSSSRASKASTGRTPRPQRRDSVSSRPKSHAASSELTQKPGTQAPNKTSRPPSRAPSKPPPVTRQPSHAQDPPWTSKAPAGHKMPSPINTQFYVAAVPAPANIAPASAMTPTYHPTMAPYPAQDHVYSPAPPAVPRSRARSIAQQSRPHSIAVSGGTWVPDSAPTPTPAPAPAPASTRPAHPVHAYSGPPVAPDHPHGAMKAEGVWVKNEVELPRVQQRPTLTQRPTDPVPVPVPSRRLSIHGAPSAYQQYQQTPPSSYYRHPQDQGYSDMPPPPLPGPPRRSSSRRPSNEPAYEEFAYVNDPNQTIRARRNDYRPAVQHQRSQSKAALYHRPADARYPEHAMMVERYQVAPARLPPRIEKIHTHVQQAEHYQDNANRQVNLAYDEPLVEPFSQLGIGQSSPTHHRRTSQTPSRPGRSRSRAGSSMSQAHTDIGSMKLTMLEDNAVQIDGDTEGKPIMFTTEGGKPVVTIGGGQPSPTKMREKRYLGGGSRGSGASFAERSARANFAGSPSDTLVSETQRRRRSGVYYY